ncbi:MAG TPA: type II toxin-antitoxin system HicB family antitoxin [Candidatus Thermoplasmatota archaeon]|nr:type II toxin-antitoxin system HicB family antitoxin [Candidatus Thermoplasmatota archaeon]
MDFFVVLEEDEGGSIVADVPQLPGCHTFGETKEAALRHIREAIELYLAVKGPPQGITVERISVEA